MKYIWNTHKRFVGIIIIGILIYFVLKVSTYVFGLGTYDFVYYSTTLQNIGGAIVYILMLIDAFCVFGLMVITPIYIFTGKRYSHMVASIGKSKAITAQTIIFIILIPLISITNLFTQMAMMDIEMLIQSMGGSYSSVAYAITANVISPEIVTYSIVAVTLFLQLNSFSTLKYRNLISKLKTGFLIGLVAIIFIIFNTSLYNLNYNYDFLTLMSLNEVLFGVTLNSPLLGNGNITWILNILIYITFILLCNRVKYQKVGA